MFFVFIKIVLIWVDGMAQVVEFLSSEPVALSSNPRAMKKIVFILSPY
jgi:hypothetical protein